MADLAISIEESADPGDIRRLDDIINQYNLSVMKSDYRPLTILLRNPHGEVVGGLHGKTEWGWLYVETLAIREEYRSGGYGTKLLEMAEQEALARGCHGVFLDTFSFQARPFYEERGYEVFGVLENFTRHTKYFMRKKLDPGDRSR